ncbi:MAG TPA: hypothetical protein DCQ31_00710, partial [Bacteroidales bacterium]|nr:hypothetical protein [Bacteroidales bacterium]
MYSYGQYWSEKIEAEANAFYSPVKNLNISLNAYFSTIPDVGDKTDAPYSNSPGLLNRAGGVVEGESVNTTAFYGQVDYSFLNHFKLVVGGRTERLNQFNLVLYRAMYDPRHTKFAGKFTDDSFKFVPRAALIASINKNHVFKIMYGEALKMPAIWELRNNLVVNESLKPERIRTVELNYIAQFGDIITANVSVFKNYISDVVLRSITLTGTNYTSYFANGAEIQTTGAEFNVSARPFKGFRAEVSGAYQNSSYHSLGMENVAVEFSPELLMYLKASYQITNNMSFAITGNYVDAMESQWDNQPKTPPTDMTPKGRFYGQAVAS